MTAIPTPTSAAAPCALLDWAALPGPARVLDAARARLEAGHTGDRVRVAVALSSGDRNQLGRLLGLSWAASDKDVTLGLLRAACTRSSINLDTLLITVGGPMRDLRAEKDTALHATQRRRDDARIALLNAGAAAPVVDLVLRRRWLGAPDDPNFAARVEPLTRLIRRLPGDGILLANLAQELTGDPHALDRDRVLGRAAARVLAATLAHDAGPSAQDESDHGTDAGALAAAADRVGTAAGWRAAWSSAGVSCDQLSSTVLVLNVTVTDAGPAGALLRAAAEQAEPLWLTARTLRTNWPPPAGTLAGVLVRVCENPSVVEAAAEELGLGCPPLVCTYGRPSLAALELLRGLAVAGARLEVSADRDLAGRSIETELLRLLPEAAAWLPDAPGMFEEQRLPAFLHDLRVRH